MTTRVLSVKPAASNLEAIREAAGVLDEGGIVVLPTETVYGVAARADRPAALQRLRNAKLRGGDQPFTVHLGRPGDAEQYVNQLSPQARRLIRKGWPGPLTLLLATPRPHETPMAAKTAAATVAALYHDGYIGLRCPDEATASELLNTVNGPVVAASANLAGRPAPRTVEEALADLEGQVDLALDAGPTRFSQASTIVRVHADRHELVREGVYDDRMLRAFGRVTLLFVCSGNTCRSPMAAAMAGQVLAQGSRERPRTSGDIHVVSAGTAATSGSRASAAAVEVMATRGLDLSSHRSQPLTIELIRQADYIFAMTAAHRETVLRMVPSASSRTLLLNAEGDISDPFGADEAEYAACAEVMAAALRVRLSEVEL